jgi:hypothetical protein
VKEAYVGVIEAAGRLGEREVLVIIRVSEGRNFERIYYIKGI